MSEHKRPQAGKAFQKALESDPKAQAALRRTQARLRSFGKAVRVLSAVVSGSLWGDLTKAVTDSLRPIPRSDITDVGAACLQAQSLVIEDFAKRLSKAQDEARAAHTGEWRKLSAELDAAEQQYEIDWKKETGVAPPRWTTVDDLENVAIPWWQKQAALAGIDPGKILDAGEKVLSFEPIIQGKLKLLRLQAATTIASRRRPPFGTKIPKMTARQLEAVQIVGECKGNFAEAGRRMGLDRKTVKQHYDGAMKKMQAAGLRKSERKLKTTTRRLPESRRGEVDAFKDEDGQNRPGAAWRSGKRQSED